MEINKITFESFKTDDITKSFEDLDVNGDGKITNADLSATESSAIKSQIKTLLNAADDEPVLQKSGASKNKYGVNETNAKNFAKDVENSTGTVYVVMGNLPGCGRCVSLEKKITEKLSEIEEKAQVFNMQWNDNAEKCRDIYHSVSNNNGGIGFPVVVKFVDGKPVELISEGSADYAKVVKNMISKAEGTPGTTGTTKTTTEETTAAGGTAETTTTATTSTVKTEADIDKAVEEILAKYPPEKATQDYDMYSTENPELVALKKAMEDGAIDNLSAQGFSRDNIIAIFEKAYPHTGIKANNKGGFDCPYGHGDAKGIYDMFVDKMAKVTSGEKSALLAQVKELNAEINTNNLKLGTLKGAIEVIQKEVEGLIEDAIKESEEIQEDQKGEASRIVREELDKYATGNGEITYDDFQKNVSDKLDTLSGTTNSRLSSVVLKMINAEGKMGVLRGYMDSFKFLVDSNKTLSDKVKEIQSAADQAGEGEAKDVSSRCDPIGFTVNGVKYDFFVDKDADGKLSNEKEFLGANNGWSEMAALDADGDGKVTVAEMGDMMIVTTDAEGNQVAKKASEVLGENDTVDLNSYKAVNKDFENGNTLLGTFSMTFNGQEVKDAYNTMDKISWLDENYEFSDKEKGINRFAQGNSQTDDILDYSKELDDFNAKYTELEGKMSEVWNKVGVTRADVYENIQAAESEAAGKEAKQIEELLKKKTPETENTDNTTAENNNGGENTEV